MTIKNKEPIRILCVFATLNRGGAESMCMNLYRNIDRTKVQFDFIKHTDDKCAFEDEILSLGGKIYNAPHFSLKSLRSYKKWWNDFLTKHNEYRIIHCHYFTICTAIFPVAKKHKLITIAHCHSAYKAKNLRAFLEIIFMRQAAKYTDYRLACTEDAGKMMYGKLPFMVIYNAINVEDYTFNSEIRKKIRNELSIDDDTLLLGTVGRIEKVKNPHGIIDIVNLIRSIRPKTSFLWVGDGIQHDETIKYAKTTGAFDNIIFVGVKSNVNDYIQAMDVFIMPSLHEGFPVTMVEAQANGIKCFVSDTISKATDITGLVKYLPINNYDLWVNEIMTCDKQRVNTLKKVKEAGFDIKQTSKELEDFYLSL
ncbi:MAG: glycosyltransferase [Clostridia bacterium]|nr:glycosyltransferase [Clostridia bacterium]